MQNAETQRLALLHHYDILDTAPDQGYDDLVALASAVCGVPVALITMIDRDRQWFKARHGVELTETPRAISFCTHAIEADGMMVVPDATRDARFAENPLVTGDPHIRFYAGVPLEVHGLALGTLCVLDSVPRELTSTQRDGLTALARQARALLEAQRSRRELEIRTAELERHAEHLVRAEQRRHQLAELIVHDLKSPLTTLLPCGELLLNTLPEGSEAHELVASMFTASQDLERMVLGLLDVSASEDGRLAAVLEDVALAPLFEQLQTAFAYRCAQDQRALALECDGALQLRADRELLRRVLENLIDNALKYAPSGTRVALSAARVDDHVVCRVADLGPGIPRDQRAAVFDKHVRLTRDVRAHARTSRGLGLSFCRLAVEAQGGEIWIEDNAPIGSVFCFRLARAC